MQGENSPTVRWEEMFPDQLLSAIKETPICYAAYGLAEPHGPYNALGLDWLKARSLVEMAAREHGGVVAPPCAWHVQEQPHFDWVASQKISQSLASSIPGDLFLRLVLYQIRAMDARGFHAGVLITGHYGGLEEDMRLLCEYYVRRTGSPIKLLAAADGEVIRFEDYRGDHAGVCETSQLMALMPDLVDLSQTEKDSKSGPWAGMAFPDDKVRTPNRELGEKIVASQIANLGEVKEFLLESYEPRVGWKAPDLTETEDVWHRFERATRKYWMLSSCMPEFTEGLKPPFPGWESLGE
ncbi:MAG: creatininase family protein [Candidatus Latescibacteria bacterium]|jgi:creatinine amidohydrolase|nr:creatininase family protein [Candidatus Latescibacterota bacterium]